MTTTTASEDSAPNFRDEYTRTLIEPTKGWSTLKLGELWAYRELVFFLVWRDIKIRYKQTVLGASWAIIQPFFTMVVFSIVFGRFAGIPSDGVPYPLFSYAALVPWTYFATSLSHGSNSLVNNAEMIKKIYFPRFSLPLAAILAGIVDFILAFVVLLGMMFFYGYMPTINTIWLPFLFLLVLITSLGVSLWLAAMNVQFRDVKYTIPFLTQAWLFITPIAYPSSMLPQPLQTLSGLNPMAGVVEGFRWALLGTDTAPGPMIFLSSAVSILLLVSGAFYFRRMERSFADVI